VVIARRAGGGSEGGRGGFYGLGVRHATPTVWRGSLSVLLRAVRAFIAAL